MRPVSLRIRGLHSYREPQAVDFAEVTRAGVFGVFGPTGAGKSTLLDAITLALYGQVDRASHGTQGILNQLEDSLEAAFSFELRGAGGPHRYRVERRYNRLKDSPAAVRSGPCRLLETLADGGEQVIADSAQGVTQAVTSLLGLTAEDFARAVVLPQGRFAEFLHLTGAERTRMLQRLFDLERYGQTLAERIRGELARVEPELGAVQAEQTGLGDASEAALVGARGAVQAAEAAVRAAAERFAQVQAEWETWRQVWGWQGELQAVARQEAEHAGREAAVRAAAEELDASRRGEAVRPYLEAWEQARSGQRQAEERLPGLEVERGTAEEARRVAAAAHDQAQQRRRADQPALQHRRGELDGAVQLEGRLQPLREAREAARVAVDAAEADAVKAEEAHREAGARVEALQAEQGEKTRDLQEHTVDPERRERVRGALEALRAFGKAAQALERGARDLVQFRGDRDAAAVAAQAAAGVLAQVEAAHRTASEARAAWEETPHEREEDLSAAALEAERRRGAVETYAGAHARLRTCAEEHRRAEAGRAAAAEERQRADSARVERESAVRAADAAHSAAALDLREAEARDRAVALAAELEPGMPCPVCGSLDHPAPVGAVASTEVHESRERLAAAEAGLEAAREELAGARGAEEVARAREEGAGPQVQAAADRLVAADAEADAAAQALPPSWREPEPRPEPASLAPKVAAEEETLRKRREALASWSDGLQQRRAAEDAEAKRLSEAQRDSLKLDAAAGEAEAVVRTREAALAEVRRGTEEAAAALAAARGEMTDEAIEAESRAIARADRRAGTISSRLADLSREMEGAAGARQQAEAARTGAQRAREAARLTLEGATHDAGALEERLRQLTGGEPAHGLLSEVVARLAALERAEGESQSALAEAEQRVQAAVAAAESGRTQLEDARQRAREADERLRAELVQRRFASPEAAREARRTAAEQDALEGTIQRHGEEATRLRGERQRLEGLLAGRSIDEAAWLGHEEAKRQAEADLHAAQQALGGARGAREDLERRHDQWQELEQRRVRLAQERDDLADLQGVLKGAAFVDFLAEEQLRSVARDASARLARLTRGRYALEVEPREGFVIRDDHNGGVRRPVSSLSGGETFLTSLALALALSAQIQLRGRYPLEFFFLDEGFGSLDPQALDTAMDAVERLHEERVVIGVISHLPEVRARMPVRVVVEPAEPGGRGSRLRVEVA